MSMSDPSHVGFQGSPSRTLNKTRVCIVHMFGLYCCALRTNAASPTLRKQQQAGRTYDYLLAMMLLSTQLQPRLRLSTQADTTQNPMTSATIPSMIDCPRRRIFSKAQGRNCLKFISSNTLEHQNPAKPFQPLLRPCLVEAAALVWGNTKAVCGRRQSLLDLDFLALPTSNPGSAAS